MSGRQFKTPKSAKQCLLTIVLFTFMGCSGQPTSSSGTFNETAGDTTNVITKEIVVFDTTFVCKSTQFQVIAGRDENYDVYAHIIRNTTDTTTIFGAAGGVDVEDFNSDGFPDLILFYLSNHPIHDLYLFEPEKEVYIEVEGFDQVSDAKPILGKSNIYYAYQRAGCGDANWTSTLFIIQDFKVQEIGEIEAFDCEGMEENTGITAYRIVTPHKLVKVDHFPIDTIESYEDNKWGFIEDYWKTNLTKFVK